jgi:hypothetical protein
VKPEGDESQDEASQSEKVLEEALARFKLAETAEQDIRRDALEDMKFAAGDQWDPQVRASRELKRRPCLTINRLPQFIRQVTNDQRQNRPSIKAHPVDDQGDIETAKVIQGIIRHIEYNSNADTARDTAFEGAVRGGFGYYRVVTQYESPTSFNQEILTKRIRNPMAVFFDPNSTEPDGSDANFAFVVETLSKEDFKRQYPKAKLSQSGEWETIGNDPSGWMEGNTCRVAEYFYKEYREATLVQLSGGEVVEESKLQEFAEKAAMRTGMSPDLTVVNRRQTQLPSVRWCKLALGEILEETDWPGIYIPIIPVYGEELVIDGKRILKGIIRDAKDSQRMLNVWKSAETETIGLAPKAPWVADAKTIEGYEHIWQSANTESYSVLPFNSRPDAPPPQRQAFEPAVQAITQAAMLAADDLKATTGIYDAALGAKSNENSGIAIQRRNIQAQTSNFHFTDNLTRSIRHEGRIYVDLIPHIYDTARAARIIGEDGEQKIVKLNQPTGETSKDGKPLIYDLSVGKYDVTVDLGPSFASKRQEAAASMLDLAKTVPQLMQAAPDLVAKSLDWPGAQELAERLKKTVPPNLIDDPANKNGQQIPPQVQQQMTQMGQMVEQLTQKLHAAQDQLDHKILEIESKERIEMAKLQLEAEITMAKLGSQESLSLLQHQIAEIEGRMQMLHASQPIQDNSSNIGPQAAGGMPALGTQDGPTPTGGESPGLPMEGLPPNDQ